VGHARIAEDMVRLELVERARSGDRDAFEALALELYDQLYSISRRILRDGEAAEDAVQDALLRGWRDLRSLRDAERFEAWMHRLLIRACHDHVRSRRRFAAEVRDIQDDRSDPGDDYAGVEARDEIERAFLQMSFDHRAVLVLVHYVGLSAPEVALILGIPPGTVYSRLHYAVRHMREALAPADATGRAALAPVR
jgi:RNA polymerase sigma-70 factor, ECF subfamily